MNPTTIAIHRWAVEVSYLLTTAKPEGWQELMDDLITIEYHHGLIAG